MILNADTLDETAAWLGKPGNLVPIPNQAGAIAIDHERMTRYQTTITGGRIAQYAPSTMRAWKVSIPELSPVEKGNVIAGFRSIGYPWALATIDGWMHNLMTPHEVGFEAWANSLGVKAGPVSLPAEDGDRVPNLIAPARIVMSAYTYVRVGQALCLPGVPVTASAWMKPFTSYSALRVQFQDAAMQSLTESSKSSSVETWNRVSVTATPPAGAAWAVLHVACGEVAAPSISWTTAASPWTEGMGCHAVVPSAPKLSLSPDRDGAYWDIELELSEVN